MSPDASQKLQIKVLMSNELRDRLSSIQTEYEKLGSEYCAISQELQERRNRAYVRSKE